MSDESRKPLEQDQPAEDDALGSKTPADEVPAPSESASEEAPPAQGEVSDDPSALEDESPAPDEGVEDPEVAAAREAAAENGDAAQKSAPGDTAANDEHSDASSVPADMASDGGGDDGGDDDGNTKESDEHSDASSVPADMASDGGGDDGGDDDGEDDDEGDEGESGSMSFTEHLQELRIRLTRCFIALAVGFLACYGFSKQLFDILMEPLVKVFPPGSHLIFTALPEAFFTYIKVALVAGFFVTSPFIFYQLWLFIAPGLYKEERKYLLPIGFCSALFFVTGACFGYFVVFPFAFEFFMGFTTEFIKPFPKLNEYLGFSLKLLFAFGVIFELPLVIFFLARLGLVTSALLRKHRKYSILGCFMVSALLTPPDVVSQLLMAGPLMILYEISIYVAQIFGRREKRKDAEPEEDEESSEEAEEEPGS